MVHTSKLAFAALLIALGSHAARADPAADFPSRPIRFIAPIPPGGSTDLLTRDKLRWWDEYHARVLEIVGPQLEGDVKAWLEEACAPLSKG